MNNDFLDNYNPFRLTAIHRKEMSKPTQHLLSLGVIKGDVLDYGCGYGVDCYLLNKSGVKCTGYDKHNEDFKNEDALTRTYDTVICNYVFNVIPDIESHKKTIDILKRISDDVFIAVRSDSKAIKDSWRYIESCDGYITPKGSFQRFYDVDKVRCMFGGVSIISKTSSYILFQLLK